MRDVLEQLFEFSQLPKCRGYVRASLETFYREFAEMADLKSLAEVKENLGPAVFPQVDDCALDYVFSDDHPQDAGGPPWNIVEAFLAHNEGLSPQSKEWLVALRNSYLGVYQVSAACDSNGVATLDDLVEAGTHQVATPPALQKKFEKGEIFGARLLKLPKNLEVAPSLLPITSVDAEKLAPHLREVHALSRKEFGLNRELQRHYAGRSEAHIDIRLKTIWAPKIATVYIAEVLLTEDYSQRTFEQLALKLGATDPGKLKH